MPRQLPNLDWLRVFSETAATESFALAAQRLGVTPGAVSQRIKALETFLGVSLFQRYSQGVRLTETGKAYAQRVAPALNHLVLATQEITSAGTGKAVRLTILPALAQLWLGPRMDLFHALHSNASVEIWADAEVVDLRTSNFDIAIRHARPPFPGCESRELFFDELVPVASPKLMAACERDHCGLPKGVPLLVDSYWEHDFADWLNRTGQTRTESVMVQAFSLYAMAVEAALNGRGFLMGHTALVGDLIREGKLCPLSDKRVPSMNQFYLVTKAATPLSDAAERFANWITEQAHEQSSPAGGMQPAG